jgi:hypothetical protein
MHVAALERTVRGFRLIFVCGLPLLLCLPLLTGQSPAEDPNRVFRVQEWVSTGTGRVLGVSYRVVVEGSVRAQFTQEPFSRTKATLNWRAHYPKVDVRVTQDPQGVTFNQLKRAEQGTIELEFIGEIHGGAYSKECAITIRLARLAASVFVNGVSGFQLRDRWNFRFDSSLTEAGTNAFSDAQTSAERAACTRLPGAGFNFHDAFHIGSFGFPTRYDPPGPKDQFTTADGLIWNKPNLGYLGLRIGSSGGSPPLGFPLNLLKEGKPFTMSTGKRVEDRRGSNWVEHNEGMITVKFLGPLTEELEVVVEPEDYDNWLPTGGDDELTPGKNDLKVHARLQTKDGKPASQAAKRFKFQLVDVSHEPGVSLNYPPRGRATADFKDLQFEPKRNGKLIVRPSPPVSQSSPEQAAQTADGKYTEADAVISAYDWGAWGTLKVTADMPDGSVIIGHLKGDPSRTDILLPKRQENSKIADRWKRLYDVASLSDDDDGENNPVGDGYRGDGLSLYEEYRGFHANGVHNRGNPTKKDFFLVNEIGARAEPGITIFERLTGLLVHRTLTKDELDADRCINCNHGYAHVVDQHGVRLTLGDLPFTGGSVCGDAECQGGRPGTPKDIVLIVIHMGSPNFLSSLSSRQSYTHVIGHELLHSVNVWHHGENDIRYVEWKTGMDGHGNPVVLETSLNDKGQPVGPGRPVAVYNVDRRIPPSRFTDGLRIWVAVRGGQHSGNLKCLMRYDVAGAYVADSKTPGIDRRQWIPIEEEEPIGLELCTVRTGPQRFGNTASGQAIGPANRGDCKHQIRVSDR